MVVDSASIRQFDADEFVEMARYGELQEMQEFLTNFSPSVVCTPNSQGNTAIHTASANNHETVLHWLFSLLGLTQNDSPTVLPAEHVVNHKNNNGSTPLHWATMSGSLGTIEMLLKAGANSELRDGVGEDAVECAERFGKNEAIQLIVSYRVKTEGAPSQEQALDMNGDEVEVDEEHVVRMDEDGTVTIDGEEVPRHELER